ncbi:hypothetical protein BRADI_5g22721v3 [Brachypodium distachyon]|uniref:Uncharacterized protein n=1 Tax=Brachypodium distachyon TaxID=15368 RepID=A0A0Q3KX90_BRADI|nr:hypothetical protein BRADI_5g22721v3 [Brachypodium distachyon]
MLFLYYQHNLCTDPDNRKTDNIGLRFYLKRLMFGLCIPAGQTTASLGIARTPEEHHCSFFSLNDVIRFPCTMCNSLVVCTKLILRCPHKL